MQTRDYEHEALYRLEIRDQSVVKKNDGNLAVKLTLEPLEKMKDKWDPGKGAVETLPEEKRIGQEVWLNLANKTLETSIKILRSLGFNSYNFVKLNPDFPGGFHDLRGKYVYAQASYALDRKDTTFSDEGRPQNEKLWWNVRLFQKVKTPKEQLQEQEAAFKDQEDVFKQVFEDLVSQEKEGVPY